MAGKIVTKIYEKTVSTLMLIFVTYLTVKSIFIHMDMPLNQVSEKSIIRSNIWPVYILMAALLFFCLYKNREKIKNIEEQKLLRNLVVYDFLLGILWLVLANTREGADQAQVLYAAKQFTQGNFSKLSPDQYMGMFPYQLPLALLYEPFYILMGDVTPFFFQLINIFLICGIQILLYKLGKDWLFPEYKSAGVCILLAEFLDLPIILYVSFVYGTVIGLFFSLLAFYLFCKSERKSVLFLASCSMALACLLRMNNMVFMIAFNIIGILLAITKKKAKALIVLISIVVLFAGRYGVNKIYELRSGMEIPKGEPLTLNIAMGFSENEERAPGWYNGYTWDKYLELGCDYELSDSFAKEEIRKSLTHFGNDPLYALSFMQKKIDSMWLNPDFQGLWNNEHHGQYVACAPIIYNLYTGELHQVAGIILSFILFLIYMGTFLFFLLHFKSISWKQCGIALCFIGGFLFHLFWEAKAQYVIVYYCLLFPYAAMGFAELVRRIGGINLKKDF